MEKAYNIYGKCRGEQIIKLGEVTIYNNAKESRVERKKVEKKSVNISIWVKRTTLSRK